MKQLQRVGMFLLVTGVVIFTVLPFSSTYRPDGRAVQSALSSDDYEKVGNDLVAALENKRFDFSFDLTVEVKRVVSEWNEDAQAQERWDEVIHSDAREVSAAIGRISADGYPTRYPFAFFMLTFGLAVIGGLMYIIPTIRTLGAPGIKNDGIYHSPSTNRGWIAYIVFGWLIAFYIGLYFFPELTIIWQIITEPVSLTLFGNESSRWFVYGLMYTVVMTVMAVKMAIKYRHSRYQLLRTGVVLFFQVAFAFILAEVLTQLNLPGRDLKNIWPLDYSFFFSWRLDEMLSNGTFGLFMLVWGVALIVIAVPVLVYFYGKRWYCSWVCGCGGLAETLGDPYRHLSDKSLKSWQVERWLVHGVLVFAVIMTALTLYTWFTEEDSVLGLQTWQVQKYYGFLIGSIFAGVIGTGFYPIFGNRVWCRFGCPLAAYLGLVQRFKSRFRITTNGAQCISCGNCSTYCEMGIDVKWYAQRGQNIVRSSCVGCGICAEVCPRGVLKLENGSEKGRINDNPILIGREGIQLSGIVEKSNGLKG